MYGRRIGIAGLACALVVLAGCTSTTGGQALLADSSPAPATAGHIRTTLVPPGTTSPPPGHGYAVWGHVLTNAGAAVPHVTIELIPPGHVGINIFSDTGSDGGYGLTADGVFTLLCITPTPDYACGPAGGDGNPFLVDTAHGPQRLDFILCRAQDYPRCLTR